MPRSNSSFDVAEGGSVVSAALAPGPGPRGGGAAAVGGGKAPPGSRATEIERLAGPASAGGADRRVARHWHLATAERARRAGGVGILAGVESIAATAATDRRGCRVLHDRRGRRDLRLLVVAGLGLRIALLLARPLLRITLLRIALLRITLLPLRRAGLNWRRCRGHVGLRTRGLATRRGRCGAELTQPILKLAVTVLQFLVLAGQLPELVFQPLDPHLQVGIIGLGLDLLRALRRTLPRERDLCGRGLHRQSQHRGNRRGTGGIEESG
jgi:hypothetical protein